MEDEEAVDHQVYGPHRSSFDCQFDVKRIFAKAGALDVFGSLVTKLTDLKLKLDLTTPASC